MASSDSGVRAQGRGRLGLGCNAGSGLWSHRRAAGLRARVSEHGAGH